MNQFIELTQKTPPSKTLEGEKRATERELMKASEDKYRALVENGSDVILVAQDERFKFLNSKAMEISGYSQEEILSKPFLDFIHPSDRGIIIERYLKRLRGDEFLHVYPFRMVEKSGKIKWMEIHATQINWEGKPASLCFLSDITERRKAEESLQDSEEKYRVLVENANEAIFIRQDDLIKFPNPKTLSLTGYAFEELSNIPFLNLVHADDRSHLIERTEQNIQKKNFLETYSFRILNKTRDEIWVQMNFAPVNWEGKPATLNFLRNVTQEKKLEAQFQFAQKMEAIGNLASGIAHDFNNLLMGIQGYVSLMLLDVDPNHHHWESLKRIGELVKGGSGLTSQLLAFARKGKYEVKTWDVNKIILKSSTMFEHTKKEIRVHRRLQENVWNVEVDRGQIEQALLNLYVNAWQAMPEGGDLYLETKNVRLDQNYKKPFAVKPGIYVRISITDTGVGIAKEIQEKIFEPFFTTKEMGRGTGLGLASVYGIVKNHGGIINVYSEEGHGTTFHLYFPASHKEIIEEKGLSGEILKGNETILLVDDENTIVEVVGKALQMVGYQVLVAKKGEEAIEIYQKNNGRVALIILDMIMPGMGGQKVYDRLKEINPKVKVILASGYSIDSEASHIMDKGCNGFIQKPFGIKELSEKIREVLDLSC
jgi:two-component system, cell cycle sensor histidine kinase and response regulator CckA